MLRRGCPIIMMATMNGGRRRDDEGKYSEFITAVSPELNGLAISKIATVAHHRDHLFARNGRVTYPRGSRIERELSSELHYSGVSRRGLFPKAIRLGLYTCILYVCIYIHTHIYILIPSMSIR